MSAEASDVQSAIMAIPEIIVTEPSPIQKPSATPVPIQEKAVLSREESTGELCTNSEQTGIQNPSPEQTISSLPESSSNDESCVTVECIIPVPEAELEQAETATESSETDEDDEFRTYRCCELHVAYEYLWNILESRYAILFWLVSMILPVSAGIMGAVYMFSCPASSSLPNMIFMIGISLLSVLTLRVCLIIHRMTWNDENTRAMLQTLNLISLFITSLFCITESVTFWQMNSSVHPTSPEFCHPTFSTYAFWWNIAVSVLMVIIFMFPIG